MIKLSRTYLRWATEPPFQEVERLAERAHVRAEEARHSIDIDETGVEVSAELGSLALAVEILTYAGILIGAIGGYASFWDGVARIKRHARVAGGHDSKAYEG